MMRKSAGTAKWGSVRSLWTWWKRVAQRIGDVQARVLLTFLYFVIFAPFALAVRWGTDSLAIKTGTPRGWCSYDSGKDRQMESASRQF
jgi:hypothetical protein